jgi:uncharacterized membrane protein
MRMRVLRTALVVAYPLLVWLALRGWPPRQVAVGLGAVLALRGLLAVRRLTRSDLRRVLPAVGGAGLVVLGTLVSDDARFLRLAPALVNLALLAAFARSLWRGPPIVETFARMQHPDLTPPEILHCRRVTMVWCVFFAGNASVCLWLALAGSLDAWALYTGVVAYGLIALLFGAEFLVRARRFGRYEGSIVAPLFRRLSSGG